MQDVKSLSLDEKNNLAIQLYRGWARYTRAFGQPPHGTIVQFKAMFEFSDNTPDEQAG